MSQSDNKKIISLGRFIGEVFVYSIVVTILLSLFQSFIIELIQNKVTNDRVFAIVNLIVNIIFLWISYFLIFNLIFNKYKVKASEIPKFKKTIVWILTISSGALLISRMYQIWKVAKIAIAFFGEKFFLYEYFLEVGSIIISLVINIAIANHLFSKNINNANNVVFDQEVNKYSIIKLTTIIFLILTGIVIIISGVLLEI